MNFFPVTVWDTRVTHLRMQGCDEVSMKWDFWQIEKKVWEILIWQYKLKGLLTFCGIDEFIITAIYLVTKSPMYALEFQAVTNPG